MRGKIALLMIGLVMGFADVFARDIQSDTINTTSEEKIDVKKNQWFESIQIRGYAQLRYNGLFETNPDLQCAQCDRSWGGETNGFFFRRIRLIFYGQVHEKVYFYIQPDLASGGSNLAQIRDAYFDLGLDDKQEFRLRIGQSKVPFGFENLQSSQNRIPLDRHDGLNSAVANERDIGVMFYYAPSEIRKRFNYLVSSGLKGSGDYGVFGFGVYNGQTANMPELNDNMHVVTRLTYPFLLKSGQFIEGSLQGYTGDFVIQRNQLTDMDQTEFREYRYGASFVMYPQPFGIQAEYNRGRGPEFNPETMDVEDAPLEGGYVMANYYLKKGKDLFIPFTRYHFYQGGKKHELDATRHRVKELEIGVEWQPNKNFELVTMYTISDRTFENSLNPNNRQVGSLLRLQAQVNF
ncbi:porin [Litoribacter alkaliphilus]|uniref:Porin n=1 Tax=Litoribacter ruber TaxID=702568 RepID=A0AAP2G462_9BACT|nr:porin [Litoribacter alkaliphilus]MBS9523716.1 porin [Litoribacter alkaliphilus]